MSFFEDDELSDEVRAQRAWTIAYLKVALKEFAGFLWPLLLSGVLLIASWPLAFAGADRGGTIAVVAISIALTATAVTIGAGISAFIGARREGSRRRLDARPNAKWWLWWGLSAVPRSALAAYALTQWLPVAGAVAAGAVCCSWPLIWRTRLYARYTGDRLDLIQAFTQQRPAGGLPTPEV